MLIRAASPMDLPEIMRLVHQVFDSVVADSFTPEGAALFRGTSASENAQGLASGQIFLIAEDVDAIIGVLRMTETGHLHTLFVASDNQLQGIATKLMEAAIHELNKRDPDTTVITFYATRNALAMYQHWGATVSGSEFDRKGMRATPMELQISTFRARKRAR